MNHAVHVAPASRRYYSSTLGRFINQDPIEEQGGINLYAFCANNGINAWDYLGMNPDPTRPMTPGEAYARTIATYQGIGSTVPGPSWAANDDFVSGMAFGLMWQRHADAMIEIATTRLHNAWQDARAAVANGTTETRADGSIAVTGSLQDAEAIKNYAAMWEAATGQVGLISSSTTYNGITSTLHRDGSATIAPNSEGYGQIVTVVPGSGTPVDAFPYANMTNADCGISAIRTIETLLTGNPARPRADIIALLGEPAGTFENGGNGMTRFRTNLNAALNPIGFQATNQHMANHADFVTLVGQGNLMVVGTKLNGQNHMVVVQPIAPDFRDVNVYNNGPTTPAGQALVRTMPAKNAATLPNQTPSGQSGRIWTITPLPPPRPAAGAPP